MPRFVLDHEIILDTMKGDPAIHLEDDGPEHIVDLLNELAAEREETIEAAAVCLESNARPYGGAISSYGDLFAREIRRLKSLPTTRADAMTGLLTPCVTCGKTPLASTEDDSCHCSPAAIPPCDLCGRTQTVAGAVLWGPPDSAHYSRKWHVCVACYVKVTPEDVPPRVA